MRRLLTAATVAAFLLGTAFLVLQPQERGGVTVWDVEDFTGPARGGVCAAKARNTNSHPVAVFYRFAGGAVQQQRIAAANTTILSGFCSRPRVDLINVTETDGPVDPAPLP